MKEIFESADVIIGGGGFEDYWGVYQAGVNYKSCYYWMDWGSVLSLVKIDL